MEFIKASKDETEALARSMFPELFDNGTMRPRADITWEDELIGAAAHALRYIDATRHLVEAAERREGRPSADPSARLRAAIAHAREARA